PVHSSRRALPQVSRYEAAGAWRPASFDELNASDDRNLTTVILVHGNDTDDAKARAKGLTLYQALTQEGGAPLRLILWSWPADYIPGTLRQDARVKAERAEADSYYLARFITALDSAGPLRLLAYSLGARVVTGALHLLGGGSLDGQNIDVTADRELPPVRVVLMAAAIDDDWLLPGRRHGRALEMVDRMVALVNPQDRILRFYRLLGSGSAALGVRGVASPASLGPYRRKFEQLNVNPIVGGQHAWSSYASSPQILGHLKRELLRE
ncbi:MAG: hypothetical protein ACREHD_06990, partial [Pirellulales bacterium]